MGAPTDPAKALLRADWAPFRARLAALEGKLAGIAGLPRDCARALILRQATALNRDLERREGLFNSALSWALNHCLSAGSILLAHVALHFVGCETALKAAQTPEAFLAMRIVFAGVREFLAGLAAIFILRYSVIPEAVAAA